VLYLYFVPFIGFQIKYDDDDDDVLCKCRYSIRRLYCAWDHYGRVRLLVNLLKKNSRQISPFDSL